VGDGNNLGRNVANTDLVSGDWKYPPGPETCGKRNQDNKSVAEKKYGENKVKVRPSRNEDGTECLDGLSNAQPQSLNSVRGKFERHILIPKG